MRNGIFHFVAGAMAAIALLAAPASAQKKYDTGASDTEIKIGQTLPFSGPASAYATIGKAQAAYIKMVNEQGGVNGRRISLIQYDDAYSPPKTVEQVRKLVESDEVLLTFQLVGTPSNRAVQKYLNAKKVPQLFAATGASQFTDPKNFPWTIGFNPNYQTEGRIYAQYILKNYPNAKVGVFYQNDDLGRDYLTGLKEGLGNKAATMIVGEASYEISDPTIDSQIVKLKSLGADLLYDASTPKFAAQAIKKAAELGWKPVHILDINATSVGAVLQPAGLEASKGLISSSYGKDPLDPIWKDDAGLRKYFDFMAKYYPDGDKNSNFNTYGYSTAQLLVQVLKQCGDDLTRENVLKQATNLKDVQLDLSFPGIVANTSPTDYRVNKQLQMMRFNGERWELFGPIIKEGVTDPKAVVDATKTDKQPSAPPIAAVPAVGSLAVAPSAVAPPAGRRVALVLGNASYKFMPTLQNPRNDAVDIEAVLKSLGFDTVLATDTDRLGMNAAVSRFSRMVTGADIALVFYSGHGMQFAGKNYLLPIDANLESAADVNRFQLMPVDDLIDMLGAAKGLQMLVLDACRNNPVERSFKNMIASVPGGNRDAASTRGFSRISARSGLLVTYATAADQVASDGTGRNSPFTKAFLNDIVIPDLEVRQMLYRVQSDVYSATNSQQLPEISSLYIGPDIRLKPAAGKP